MDTQQKSKKWNTQDYFPCYSPRVLEHLLANGFQPEASFVNMKTLKTCHQFKKNDEVCKCIAEVSNKKVIE